ncbi:MAG: L-seryl-tRNA(Sec) selenium transferase [Candidatus Delongbacteria bacterium]|nr:L-seryl-tRNA(Sec) selenium transferase [Candidatus Delongbacteria bacterium]MBN2836365.1 L-seryl-tRNA(Sec) selenium transferase [Candidatus Delongbacteria bacterium]
MNKELLKSIPKIDNLIKSEKLEQFFNLYERNFVLKFINEVIDELRSLILAGKIDSFDEDWIIEKVHKKITDIFAVFTGKVVNGTGIVLNTGLGRAPLSENAIDKLNEILRGYSTLEVDVESGKRGRREDKIDSLVALLTGAEAATVVNNNAAAVMICLNTLSEDKEVVISRGEQVEIGGAFRMPDIIKKSGAIMIEVGTTNKTHLKDYENAISENTGALVKVHTSNYRVMGFTKEIEIEELAELGKKHNVETYFDLGGGVIKDLSIHGLPYEPLVSDSLKAGIGLVSFSGDKSLGGPQCGVIAGKKELIDRVKKNPLMRAFRMDKLRLSLLEETLKGFFRNDYAKLNKTYELLTTPKDKLKEKAENLFNLLYQNIQDKINFKIIELEDQAGSGTLPTETIKGFGVSFTQQKISCNRFANLMRTIGEVPVFGYVSNETYIISIRTLFDGDNDIILNNCRKIVDEYL